MCARSSLTWSRRLWALLCVGLFLLSPLAARAQDSARPSPDIGLPKPQITPSEKDALRILLPLAERVVESSEKSDKELPAIKSEVADLRKALTERLQQVGRLQSWHEDLLRRLGYFSGSDDERHAAAVAALSDIQDKASALERERDAWQYAAWAGAGAAAGAVTVSAAGGSGVQSLEGAGIGALSGLVARAVGKITGWW